jgi:sulfatase maturation enzyme AslB (radical SAM superfamily)
LFDNNLQDKVDIIQIPKTVRTSPKTENYCGAGKHMACIAPDGNIYACNRFFTMQNKMPMGWLVSGKYKPNFKFPMQEDRKPIQSPSKQM